jgi:hypothetical protein
MDGLEPIHEAQERDRKDLLQPRLVPLKPNPDHHRTNDSSAIELTAGRSVRKRARARSRSAQIVENLPCSRSGRLKDRWLLSAAFSALLAEKAEEKSTELLQVVVLLKLNSLCHSPHLDIVCSGSGLTYVEVCLERVASPGFCVYTVVVAAASLSVR